MCEYSELSVSATRASDWYRGLAAGCDRLLHPSASGEERGRQRRLLGVLFAAPFVATPAIVGAAATVVGTSGAVAVLCGLFAVSWMLAASIVLTGKARAAGWLALVAGPVLAGAIVGYGGGISTPLAALLVALPLEAWWVSRSPRAAATAGIVGVVLAAAFAMLADASAAQASHWISPLLYAGLWAMRGFSRDAEADAAGEGSTLALPEAAFDAVVVRLSASGEVETASAQARGMLRVDPELILGSGLFERVHVADRVEFLCAASSTSRDGDARRCALRIRLPQGADGGDAGYYPFEAELVKPAADRPQIVAFIRSADEKAALQDELRKAQDVAGATEVAKGKFLATVSHELRTPLNAIIGFSDMLLHREISGDMSPKQTENVRLIREAGNHLLSVVNAILDVSKIESGSYHICMEPYDLQPAVDLCKAMLEPQAAAKGVTLTGKLPRDLGDVMGDQRAVQQILLNLLSNAIKFTPEGGNVSVTALRRDRTVRIFVNDTGIGMAPDDLKKIGRPFMQIQNDYTRNFQGTGLGLSLVKGLVKLHGGSMSIESAPGMGTTVSVGLPAAEIHTNTDAAGAGARPGNEGDTGENHGIALRKIA